MFCPNCGNQMSDGASFCPNCGYKKDKGTNKFSFDTSRLRSLLNAKAFIGIIAIIAIIAIFKLITSFGEVASFASETKTVIKQVEEGNYQQIIENNLDYEGLPYTSESEAKAELLRELNSANATYLKMFKPSKKLVDQLISSLNLKYSVKKIEKNHVRLTLNYNLPRSTVISNSKIIGKVSPMVANIMQFDSNPAVIFSYLPNIETDVIEILKIYKGLDKNNKIEMQSYVDFYKSNGHWKYKLAYCEQDAQRISNDLMPLVNDWSNSIGTIASMFGF